MLRGILPKEYAFYDYFEKLTGLNVKISDEFVNMVQSIENFEISAGRIREYKKESALISQVTIEFLHRTFITPFDRDDIFSLIKGISGFTGQVNDAAARLAFSEIREVLPEAVEFAKIIQKGTVELDIAVKGLRQMKKNTLIREKCGIVHELEDYADDVMHSAINNLFKQNDILLILKWKEIFERLEKSTDRLDRVASVIETIMIDNS